MKSTFGLAHCVSYGTKKPSVSEGIFLSQFITSFPYHPFIPYHHPSEALVFLFQGARR